MKPKPITIGLSKSETPITIKLAHKPFNDDTYQKDAQTFFEILVSKIPGGTFDRLMAFALRDLAQKYDDRANGHSANVLYAAANLYDDRCAPPSST